MSESLEDFAVRVVAYKAAARKAPGDLTREDCEILRSPPMMPAEWPSHWPPRATLRDEWPPITLERLARRAQGAGP